MVNSSMYALGAQPSAIREIFEFGNRLAAEIGRENVFDFSLGNPSVPAPDCVTETLVSLCRDGDPVALHGYTSAVGAPETRRLIAEDLVSRYGADVRPEDIYMTCGAAASLTVSIRALSCPEDEFIVIAPFFPEYRVFVEATGARLVIVPADLEAFQIDFAALEKAFTKHTKALIINTPNNPSGARYSEETLSRLAELLREKSAAFGAPIYLICDEPYRELVFDGKPDRSMTARYENTILCYSFSKSLSLPGERIGYIALCAGMPENRSVFTAVCGAGRALGYVCAPSMMQKMVPACLGQTADVSIYRENRDLLYGALTEYGYSCVEPGGAFYLFVRSPEPDAKSFCERAKKYHLLLVPSDSFGVTGFVRISYCVSTDMIRRSLPAFRMLMDSYC